MGSYGSCQAYPENVYLLAIRGPTCSESMLGIEPGSPNPQSSLLPLCHRSGQWLLVHIQQTIYKQKNNGRTGHTNLFQWYQLALLSKLVHVHITQSSTSSNKDKILIKYKHPEGSRKSAVWDNPEPNEGENWWDTSWGTEWVKITLGLCRQHLDSQNYYCTVFGTEVIIIYKQANSENCGPLLSLFRGLILKKISLRIFKQISILNSNPVLILYRTGCKSVC